MSMEFQPVELYSNVQIRALEKHAMEAYKLSEHELMERAGHSAYTIISATWDDLEHLVVLCGPGNNGGDGYVVARLAALSGISTEVFYLGDIELLRGAAKIAHDACISAGVDVQPYDSDLDFEECDLIVDAILGTGLQREVEGEFLQAITHINDVDVPVFALDVPSGLNSDTGYVMGDAVVADLTVTFIGAKLGLYTGAGKESCGEIVLENLDLPEEAFEQFDAAAYLLDEEDAAGCLGIRPRDAHKGEFGHVLVVGGNYGMPGSVRMSAEAAYRVGAGLVTVATRPEHIAAVVAARPEVMCFGVEESQQLLPLLEKADVIVVGPGLDRDEWGRQLLQRCLDSDKPLIVDADGLNLLGDNPMSRDNWILTPHPGEAGRLLGLSTEQVQQDRFAAIKALQEKFAGHIILKGSGTLILSPGEVVSICDRGNPGMASGGMGDILSGVLAGLVAQGLELDVAAQMGVVIHSYAGDLAAENGEAGLMATDLLPFLREVINKL